MAKTAKITLGGEEYTIHAFNIGELERVTDIINSSGTDGGVRVGRVSFAILRIALERAAPSVDPGTVELDMDELTAASQTILELAGLKAAEPNPPTGQETGEA
jgi:hypothetical protein